MWPFKRPNDQPLMMVRYTYDAYKILFPNSTKQMWEDENHPENVSSFIKSYIINNASLKGKRINQAIITTIDKQYIEWLNKNNKSHSDKTLKKYLSQHDDAKFWNDRLIESGMTSTYSVLGIPSLVILHNFEGQQSKYTLSKESSEKITDLLRIVYNSDNVFVPGWITKGCDMPKYISDIIQIAESFWKNGMRIRFGQYLEQRYEQYELMNKFVPLHFVIPFVIKSNITNSEVNLSGVGYTNNDKFEHAMTSIRFSDKDRIDLFRLISNDINQVVSIGTNSIMPGQAYLLYKKSLAQNIVK